MCANILNSRALYDCCDAEIMNFFLQVKFNNIFRLIFLSEKDLENIGENKEKLVDTIIEKGEWFFYWNNDKLESEQLAF